MEEATQSQQRLELVVGGWGQSGHEDQYCISALQDFRAIDLVIQE
jgi:hypothetical protein